MYLKKKPSSVFNKYFSLHKFFVFCIVCGFFATTASLLLTLGWLQSPFCAKKTFSIDFTHDTFVKDGVPFRYISGSIHYFRLPHQLWRDRLKKMRHAGLNAVEIYVPWNFHEPEEDVIHMTGDADLPLFLKTAAEEDLLVILRAGPYICAEWDFGGLPPWLLRKDRNMTLRSSDPRYLAPVEKYMRLLFASVKPYIYQESCGVGPVVMVQLENEYGSYPTCDKAYVEKLYDIGREILGNKIVFFTTDGYSKRYLKCGNLDKRQFATVDFGSSTAMNPQAAFADLRSVQPHGPLVNSEYYAGWLDHWGQKHSIVSASDVAAGLDKLLSYGANVNMYMFFGGTNFAYWNGANYEQSGILPQPTSYDYDAPLSEKGDMTWKYSLLRNVIGKFVNLPSTKPPPNSSVTAYGAVEMLNGCSLFYNLANVMKTNVRTKYPSYMEALKQYEGFMLYETSIPQPAKTRSLLELERIGDRAYVFVKESLLNITSVGILDRNDKSLKLELTLSKNSSLIFILVENQGHVNYGKDMQGDLKGIIGNVTLNGVILSDWRHYSLDLSKFNKSKSCALSPMHSQANFYSGSWKISSSPTDTFLKLPLWSKGQAFVNGVNIGRYWPVKGPQITLYIPSTFLRQGVNTLVLFELEKCSCVNSCAAQLSDKPEINGPAKKISPFMEIVLRHRERERKKKLLAYKTLQNSDAL